MTPQQAGVSAEGWIYAKVEHVTKDGLIVARHWRPLEHATPEQASLLNALVSKWRSEAETGTLSETSHSLDRCADELVALATAPPEQAGPLSKEDLLALDGLEKTHPNLWRHVRECGQAVLELQQRLASHDQKVRAETLREELVWLEADWPPVPKTGVVEDWVLWAFNLDQYHRAHMAELRRTLAIAAPAASKPEAASKGDESAGPKAAGD